MSEPRPRPRITVERLTQYTGTDLDDLCEATEGAIVEGGGFGWLKAPPRQVLENYWKGVLLVPERRARRRPARRGHRRLGAAVAGAAQQRGAGFAGTLTSAFVAPWARGHGIGRGIVIEVERLARASWASSCSTSICAPPSAPRSGSTKRSAISAGAPTRAMPGSRAASIPGYYYYKRLDEPAESDDPLSRRST